MPFPGNPFGVEDATAVGADAVTEDTFGVNAEIVGAVALGGETGAAICAGELLQGRGSSPGTGVCKTQSGTHCHNRTQTPDTQIRADDSVISRRMNRKEFSESFCLNRPKESGTGSRT